MFNLDRFEAKCAALGIEMHAGYDGDKSRVWLGVRDFDNFAAMCELDAWLRERPEIERALHAELTQGYFTLKARQAMGSKYQRISESEFRDFMRKAAKSDARIGACHDENGQTRIYVSSDILQREVIARPELEAEILIRMAADMPEIEYILNERAGIADCDLFTAALMVMRASVSPTP